MSKPKNKQTGTRKGCSLDRPCSAILAVLQDPVAVWHNMLRGTIARPSCLLDISAVHVAVDSEPELPGDMPDEMWNAIRNDRDVMAEALRIAVRQTKSGILKRINALHSQNEKVKI